MVSCNSTYRLRYWNYKRYGDFDNDVFRLQQCLPFTVLKQQMTPFAMEAVIGCNSTYRLRYWNQQQQQKKSLGIKSGLQQYLPFTVLKHIKRRS